MGGGTPDRDGRNRWAGDANIGARERRFVPGQTKEGSRSDVGCLGELKGARFICGCVFRPLSS
jgi:hypothetical protein